MAKKQIKKSDGIGFEESLERVEAIIERIESGEVGLEDSITEYEKGAALIKRCRQTLDRAEQRIQELTARELEESSREG